MLYLASQSPRRAELLQQVGVQFQQFSVPVEETRKDNELARDYVERLAREKALAGLAQKTQPNAVVLGSDTIGVLLDAQGREQVLEKPLNYQHACQVWRQLSDAWHTIITAVALASRDSDGSEQVSSVQVATRVKFIPLSETLMQRYWQSGEPQDKAGGYGIQGLAAAFVERIEGSYSAVVGLPLAQTCELLDAVGIEYWAQSAQNT